ncbi:MAG: aminotransferase class I/II-fold pyridoxal phosphate-dependent enzyme, partial [Candidatus Omnitrophota bacterium]
YEKLIYDGEEHVSIGSLNKEISKLTLTVNGVSKTYSMTGWRIGYVAGPPDIIKKIGALQSHSTSNPSSISQMAALEALKGSQEALFKMKEEFVARRDYMVKRIDSFKNVSCVKPKGAFYLFCNISGTGLDSIAFSTRLLEEARVACVPGVAFGSNRHVRLSFATSMENIKTGLDRIEKWLK